MKRTPGIIRWLTAPIMLVMIAYEIVVRLERIADALDEIESDN